MRNSHARRVRPYLETLETRLLPSGSPHLLKDINPSAASSSPSSIVSIGSVVYFAAKDATHGTELWRSDGTAPGTVLLKDINPGSNSAYPQLANVNGTLLFGADDGVHGTELWISNGTAPGTVLLKDINPGNASSFLSASRM